MRLSLASSLAAVLLALPASALADNKADAKVHIDNATAAHKDGRFEDAKTELEAAYALDPQPQLLYALGQVSVKLGRCEDAMTFYEQFLQTKPAQAAADAATQAIVTCRVAIAQAQAQQKAATDQNPTTPAEPPTTTAPPVEPPPSTPVDVVGPTPWYKDKLGLSLVGAGTVSAIVGVVLYASARGTIDDAEDAPTLGEAQALTDDAKSTRTLAVVFGAAGAALVAGGIVYYATRDRGAESRSVSVIPTTSGGLVTLSGRF